jgi:hypothetical protein
MSLFDFGFSGKDRGEGSTSKKIKGRAETKEKYEKEKRKRDFYPKWKDDHTWLDYSSEENLMYCIPCRKYEKEGRFVTGTNNFRVDAIKQHESSKCHICSQRKYDVECMKEKSGTVVCSYTGEVNTTATECLANDPDVLQPPIVGALDIAVQRLNENQKEKISHAFNTAYFIAKNELPFTLYPKILELQAKNGVELPSSYQTDMACRRFMKYIYTDIQNQNLKGLKDARVLSIMFDGATDIAVCENEIIYARFIDQGEVRNVYVGIKAVEHAHAEGVLAAIESAMDGIVDGWNWKERLIATGSDGASVNLGKRQCYKAVERRCTTFVCNALHLSSSRIRCTGCNENKRVTNFCRFKVCIA